MLGLQVHIKVPTAFEETQGNVRILNGTFKDAIKKLLSAPVLFSSLPKHRYVEDVSNPGSVDLHG